MLILTTLAHAKTLHGFAIAERIEQLSEDVLRVEEGSLYPALQRLLLEGWIAGDWGRTPENRRARYYQITAAGRRQLERELSGYRRVSPGSTPGWPRCCSQCRLWLSTCPRDARARSTRSSPSGCSSQRCQGRATANTRAGAPLPPLTFTGATTTVKPRVGTAARLATFSML